MKKVQSILTILVVVAMLMSTVCLTASAAEYVSLPTSCSNYIKAFPVLQFNVSREKYGHNIKALQRYLMCFDYTCKGKLNYGGTYMDGDFGGRTKAAVVYLQEQLGFVGNNVDGIVGYNTWAAIARSLRLYPFKDSNPECGSIRRPMGVPNERVYMWENFTGIWNFEYFLENNFDTDPI